MVFYHAIKKDDMLNGEGLRITIFLAGCEHNCEGCHNPQTWKCNQGEPLDEWTEAYLFELVNKEHIDGITFSGGDPLHPQNRETVKRLAKTTKSLGKTVWLYTGYKLELSDNEFILTDEVVSLKPFKIDFLEYIDILVDGRFDKDIRKEDILKDSDPKWRGSSNQRLIDVAESLKANKIVLMEGE